MNESQDRRDFFISFNSIDLAYAQAIDTALREAGFTTYYHPRDLGPGGNIPIWVDDALMNSAQTLALYSPDYTKDKAVYSKAERYASWWQDPLSDKRKLIPILLRDTKFTPLMAMISRIEVVGKTPSEAATHVVARLRDPKEAKQRDHWRTRQPMPKIFSAAYRPNPNFTGRFEALESLVKSLREGSNVAITAVAGMGGVGKTTLAAEYCHRFGGQYGGVWWIRAEQESMILSDLMDLGQKLGLDAKQNVEEATRDCLAHLASQTQPWLLVYDNAPNGDGVRKQLPSGAVRCIITSRFTEFGDIGPVVRLDKWPNEVTRDYLLSRTERDDKDGATRLADILDGLPLAAEQAAAFLKTRRGISFDDYAADFARLIKEPRPEGAKGEYADTVYAAFVKSLAALQTMQGGGTALDILRLCAFLSSAGVDLGLLTIPWGHKVLPTVFAKAMADKFPREDAMAALDSLSLLRRDKGPMGEVIIFHVLLLAVMRDWMGKEARALWSGAAVKLVSGAFPVGAPGGRFHPASDTSVWPFYARLVPHVAALRDHLDDKHGLFLGSLLNNASTYLLARGDLEGALSFAKQGVALARVMPAAYRLNLIAGLSTVGNIYLGLDRLNEAEDVLREAVQLQEALVGPNDPVGRAMLFSQLATISAKRKDFPAAEKLYLDAAEVMEAAYGTGSANYGTALGNLGGLYAIWAEETGEVRHRQRAFNYITQSLAIFRAAYGERHPLTAGSMSELGVLKMAMADWGGARTDLERSIAIRISLGLELQPHTRFLASLLVDSRQQFGQADKAGPLLSDDPSHLLLLIGQVENEQLAWVSEDPANRHFGPPSFFATPQKTK